MFKKDDWIKVVEILIHCLMQGKLLVLSFFSVFFPPPPTQISI
jgi:hypothetical protein